MEVIRLTLKTFLTHSPIDFLILWATVSDALYFFRHQYLIILTPGFMHYFKGDGDCAQLIGPDVIPQVAVSKHRRRVIAVPVEKVKVPFNQFPM